MPGRELVGGQSSFWLQVNHARDCIDAPPSLGFLPIHHTFNLLPRVSRSIRKTLSPIAHIDLPGAEKNFSTSDIAVVTRYGGKLCKNVCP